MIEVYRIQFADTQPSEPPPIPESPTPICVACAAGHHGQPMLPNESCDCPCHGDPPKSIAYEVPT